MYALAAFVAFITLYPMYYVLILSLSDPLHAMTGEVYTLPKGFSLQAYKILTQNKEIWWAFANTILYAVCNTVLMLINCSMAGFALTFKSLRGRKYLNMYLLITMFFGGGLIPSFLLIMKLGMYDSPLALIIPGCFSVWNIILVKAYLSTIPETLREAAKIDGANMYRMFTGIYLPLSTPILAVIAVYTIVGYGTVSLPR